MLHGRDFRRIEFFAPDVLTRIADHPNQPDRRLAALEHQHRYTGSALLTRSWTLNTVHGVRLRYFESRKDLNEDYEA